MPTPTQLAALWLAQQPDGTSLADAAREHPGTTPQGIHWALRRLGARARGRPGRPRRGGTGATERLGVWIARHRAITLTLTAAERDLLRAAAGNAPFPAWVRSVVGDRQVTGAGARALLLEEAARLSPDDVAAANRYRAYLNGWHDGASARALSPKATGHSEATRAAYNDGYRDGVVARNEAAGRAREHAAHPATR